MRDKGRKTEAKKNKKKQAKQNAAQAARVQSAAVEAQNRKITQQIKELVGEFGAFIEADDGESAEIENIIINRISAQKVKEELDRLLEMKQVAQENNLVALNELIQSAEKVLATNYEEGLSGKANFTKEELITILTEAVIKQNAETQSQEEKKEELEEVKTPVKIQHQEEIKDVEINVEVPSRISGASDKNLSEQRLDEKGLQKELWNSARHQRQESLPNLMTTQKQLSSALNEVEKTKSQQDRQLIPRLALTQGTSNESSAFGSSNIIRVESGNVTEQSDQLNNAAIATETSSQMLEEGSKSEIHSQLFSQLTVTKANLRDVRDQDEAESSALQHEENANEIFETFFQRVFQRSGGNAISQKRFMRAIEKAKNEMGFSVEEEEQFKGLWDSAQKDDKGRMTSKALYEAILENIKQQAQFADKSEQSAEMTPRKAGALSHRAKAVFAAKNQLAQRREPDQQKLRLEALEFFKSHEKTFYGTQNLKREETIHLNLTHIREYMKSFEVLIDTEGNKEMEDQFAIWGLLINIIPRGDQFMGKHGQGLITYKEFLEVLDGAEQNGELKLKTESAMDLNDSFIFFDHRDLQLQQAHSSSDKRDDMSLKHKEYMKVIESDAKRVASHIKSQYEETKSETAMTQLQEIVDYILENNSHDVLGHSPESLQAVMTLLQEKVGMAKSSQDELEEMKDKIKELDYLRQLVDEVEQEKNNLKIFQDKFIESEADRKQLEKTLYNTENEKNQLYKFVQENQDLKHEKEMLRLKLDEKELKCKGLEESLEMRRKTLQRMEKEKTDQWSESEDSTEGEHDEKQKSPKNLFKGNPPDCIIEDGEESEECEVIVMTDKSHEKTRFDSKQQISSQSQYSEESEQETMDDNFFAANPLSMTSKPKKDRKISFKKKIPVQTSQKAGKQQQSFEQSKQMSESELILKGLRDSHLSQNQIEMGEARQKLIHVAELAIQEKNIVQKKLNKVQNKQRKMKYKLESSEEMTQALHQKLLQQDEVSQHVKQTLKKRDFEIDEMKLQLDEYMSSAKNLNTQMKRLKEANAVLERKLKAEQAEKMSMSNQSFVSQAGLFKGGSAARNDVLSRSIMENNNAGGNTSIMDIMSGYNLPISGDMTNKSMRMNKNQSRSFIKSQSSFYSKPQSEIKQNQSDDSGGDIQQVEQFDDEKDSDSDDCVIQTEDTKAHGTGFFYKQQLKQTVKKAKVTDQFREGESDEYDSEAEDIDINLDQLDFDLLKVKEGQSPYHQGLVQLITKFGEIPAEITDNLTFKQTLRKAQNVANEEYEAKLEAQENQEESEDIEKPVITLQDIDQDYLTSDQALVFSDEITIYQQKIIDATLIIVDCKVYFLFKDSKRTIYTPFDLTELTSLVMSPSNPMSAAFKLKDQDKLGRSHIVFQNLNMGLMVRFIQELDAYWLAVEFSDQIAMVIEKKAETFSFDQLTKQKAQNQNRGLVNCSVQGYLQVKKNEFWSTLLQQDNWESNFYVLTNVGILVFEEDNFLNPTRLIPLGSLGLLKLTKKACGGKSFGFKLSIGDSEDLIMRAPDQKQFDNWMRCLSDLINEAKNQPKNFLLR